MAKSTKVIPAEIASKKFANQHGYSDITPYEVIRVVSAKCFEVRAMKYERDTSVELTFHVGGFSANCSNQDEQKWVITPDDTNAIERIRLNKDGMWKGSYGKFFLADKPLRFYDYNFQNSNHNIITTVNDGM